MFAPGRIRANGPMVAPWLMLESSMTEFGKIDTLSPILVFFIIQFGAIVVLSPNVTSPSISTLTSISQSCPKLIVPRQSKRFGSFKVKPCCINFVA